MTTAPTTHEYAGFLFDVTEGRLTAQPGQHAAAYKEKHRMEAQAEFDAEQRRRLSHAT